MRCSVCGHVFHVQPPEGVEAQPWQICTVEDLLFSAPDIATLRLWIQEGRLHPQDKVSRTGQNWVRLGEMPEFAPLFHQAPGPGVIAAAEAPSEISAADLGPPPSFAGQREPDAPASMLGAVTRTVAPHVAEPTPVPRPVEEAVGHTTQVFAPPAPPRPPAPEAVIAAADDADPHAPTQPAIVPQGPAVARIELARKAAGPPGPPPASAASASRSPAAAAPSASTSPGLADPQRPPSQADPSPGLPPGLASFMAEDEAARSPAEAPEEEASWAQGSLDAGESGSSMMFAPRKRSRTWLWALLGTAAGVGLVVGVPQVRSRVLALAQGVAGGGPQQAAAYQPSEAVAQARAALVAMNPAEVGRAEAKLQARLDAGLDDLTERAATRLAQAELLAARALELALRASLDPKEGRRLGEQARELARSAGAALESVSPEHVPDRNELRRVRALSRLAAGRSPEEVLPLLPETGSEAARALAVASPLWTRPDAPVPPDAIASLRAVKDPSALVRMALGLAYLRGGDEAGARGAADRALAISPEQPTLLALRRAAGGEAPEAVAGSGGEGSGGEEAAGSGGEEAAGSGGQAGDASPEAAPAKKTGRSAGMSVDALIDKGCSKVERGDAAGGVELLLRAFDRRPGDLDVLVCLAKGNARLGRGSIAAGYYDRALQRSPNHRGALEGAARLAAKMGKTSRARALYQRLLEASPGHAAAKAYLEKTAPSGPKGGGGAPPPKSGTDAPATPPKSGTDAPATPPKSGTDAPARPPG